MRIDLFDFELPESLIATAPSPDRGGARMLRVRRAGPFEDLRVSDFTDQVPEGAVVVINDTRVLAARLFGTKASGGRAEIFLLERESVNAAGSEVWRAMGRANKGLRAGFCIAIGEELRATILEFTTERAIFRVQLDSMTDRPVSALRQALGQMPLPPYIKREVQPEDAVRYQTVFAREEGAVAAPTAGLHLTQAMIDGLSQRGEVVPVTLHVGLGTFAPVTVEELDEHPMHEERFAIPPSTIAALARAKREGRPIVAVGTTVVRALEGAMAAGLALEESSHDAFEGRTRILIQPGYQFRVVDQLLTNFHLPKSTLLALVSAFAGRERVLDAYAHAIRAEYKFFSYGDAMLLDLAGSARFGGPANAVSPAIGALA